ncbi:MAG: peroxiredoxin [Phycisphaerales bacterium]|nr:peroxiredoxin [Phycisphaerales bacterium]MCB9856030.1 peroxiredoxin [Phycisphaerales bacterium]MCB9863942.1 peroxiredoxin [Phycisphaerales bacterium]
MNQKSHPRRSALIAIAATSLAAAMLPFACDTAPLTDAAATLGANAPTGDNPPRSMVQQPRRPMPGQPPENRPVDLNAAAAKFPDAFRTIDGSGNNTTNTTWGSTDEAMLRMGANRYADSLSTPAGDDRPSARAVSNAVIAQADLIANEKNASDFLWQWGQFVDHDIDETPIADPSEPMDIVVPTGDVWFDPAGDGDKTIPLDRSAYLTINDTRTQFNAITAYIDASNVYGADEERANTLRTLDGTGRLATSNGNLLPFNTAGLPNAPVNSDTLFLAGDIRANEQVALTAMHTLFVREHNRVADSIRAAMPDLPADDVYEMSKCIVAAEMQAITYNEFLPVLLGSNALPPYRGYRPDVNAGIANEFATAAYRVGHSMLSHELLRIDADGNEIAAGHLALASGFFNPQAIIDEGIDPLLRGLASQVCQRVDAYLVDDVRNFLFGPPGSGGFDLASLNIQRGRDHGLPTLNQMRRDLGLTAYASFDEVTSDATASANLASVYADVEDIDLWVGGLAEDHIADAMVGETWLVIIRDQFTRLRDGDRFFYRAYLPQPLVDYVNNMTLARIIRANTAIRDELPENVFVVGGVALDPAASQPPSDIGTLIRDVVTRQQPR